METNLLFNWVFICILIERHDILHSTSTFTYLRQKGSFTIEMTPMFTVTRRGCCDPSSLLRIIWKIKITQIKNVCIVISLIKYSLPNVETLFIWKNNRTILSLISIFVFNSILVSFQSLDFTTSGRMVRPNTLNSLNHLIWFYYNFGNRWIRTDWSTTMFLDWPAIADLNWTNDTVLYCHSENSRTKRNFDGRQLYVQN